MRVDSDPQRGGVAAPARRLERPAPSNTDRQARERQVRNLVERHGCRLYRHGRAWRIVGPFTDLLVDDLTWVSARDFEPLRVRGAE